MAVYVDSLIDYGWKYGRSCHLIADTPDELMFFAMDELKMKGSWFQPKSFPHFDLTESKRRLAVSKGAIELDRRDYVNKMREIRESEAKADQ